MRPARCLKRGGDGARAEGGGIDCPGSARAVTEGYFGIGAPRNEGGEEIHTGVLRSGPIQAAWRTNGRRPRWVASSLSWSARPASASVRPPWRSVTRMNGCTVLSGCARLSVPRHRVPRAVCGSRSPIPRQSPPAGQSRRMQQSRRRPTAYRYPRRRPHLRPRLQRQLRLPPSARRRRRHPHQRFRRRRRLPPRPPQRRSQSSPAGPNSCGWRVAGTTTRAALGW